MWTSRDPPLRCVGAAAGYLRLSPVFTRPARLRQDDDNFWDPYPHHGSAQAARVSRRRRRCLCSDASKPGSDSISGLGPHLHPGRSLAMMAAFLGQWALRGYGVWACEKIDGGAFIGSIGIFDPLDWPEPEIIYSLDQPHWRQGFATEAARAGRDWLFEHFPSLRAASFIRPDNHASKRVAERLGAVCERTFELHGSTHECWVHHRVDEAPNKPYPSCFSSNRH